MARLGTSLKLLPDNCFNYFVIDEDSPADAMTDEGCRPYVERTLGRLEAHVRGLFDSDIIGDICWGPVTLKPGCMMTSGQAEGLGIGSRTSFGRHARSISADFDHAPQLLPPITPPPTVPRSTQMILSASIDLPSISRPQPPLTRQQMFSSPRNILPIGLSRHAGTSQTSPPLPMGHQPLPPLPLGHQPLPPLPVSHQPLPSLPLGQQPLPLLPPVGHQHPICTTSESAALASAAGGSAAFASSASGSATLDSAGPVLPHGAGSRLRSNSSTTPINRTGKSLPVAAASLSSVFDKVKAYSDDVYYRSRFTEATSQGTKAIYKPCGDNNRKKAYTDPESTSYRQNAIKRYCGSADSWKREIGYHLNEATESQQVFLVVTSLHGT